jgi:hypothetical protein
MAQDVVVAMSSATLARQAVPGKSPMPLPVQHGAEEARADGSYRFGRRRDG